MSFALIDIESTTLSQEEKSLLQHPCVAGLVLFTRNYESPEQLRQLTNAIYEQNPRLLITVDQEGGRVQRFREGFTTLPSQGHWGKLYAQNQSGAQQQLQRMTETSVTELQQVGVNMNLAPVLDVDTGESTVIGERSFSSDWQQVKSLAEVVIDTLHANGMPVMGKHFPGHGGVAADSHTTLPYDLRNQDAIWETDLKPFTGLIQKLDALMPAHVIYEAFDSKPATFSPFWLKTILREELGFKGLVITDDLSMAGAASIGGYAERVTCAEEAGCDIMTVCNNRAGAIEALDTLEGLSNPMSSERLNHLIQTYRLNERKKPC